MKIVYFTSTGNCLYVAKSIGGELLSIPQLEKEGIYDIKDDVVGIIVPAYHFGVPRPVRNYLNKVTIKANYIFTIMTYGKVFMGALAEMKKVLEQRNIILHYSNKIEMVDNYLPAFDIEEEIAMKKDESIELKIKQIVDDINERKHKLLKQGPLTRFVSNRVSTFMTSEKGKQSMNNFAKRFFVNNSCTACGTCRSVCPVSNIAGIGKPEYLNKCESCLACIHLCPQNAIHLKKEKNNKRFINPYIKLSEIIAANKQI
jgi:ferredoxin